MESSQARAFANRRPPAKTAKVGFLHLTDEVRKTIYEPAIYDHDRDAVFLPRALPRKVTPETDIDVAHAYDEDDIAQVYEEFAVLPPDKYFVVYPIGDDSSHSAGRFTTGLSLDVRQSAEYDDDQISVELGSLCDMRDEPDSALECDHTSVANTTSPSEDQSADDTDDSMHGGTIFPKTWTAKVVGESLIEAPRDQAVDSESGFLVDSVKHGKVPLACLEDTCRDGLCVYCAGQGLGWEEDESEYCDSDDLCQDRAPSDDDDDEHYDVEEQIGLLYELTEPAILLACREIREQCLPVYYSQNAFSWRFFWSEPVDSLQRFKQWARHLVGRNAEFIRRLTLESRHAVEEGVEFLVDIDLLRTEEEFTIEVGSDTLHDMFTTLIADGLKDELGRIMKAIPRRISGGIALNTDDLCDIGKVFLEWMHR